MHITLNGMTATVRQGGEHVTLASEVAPLGINAWRIGALERLARSNWPGLEPKALSRRLDEIEAVPALHSILTVATAIGLASGAFAYLNGGDLVGIAAAVAAGGLGQTARTLMFRRGLNQYAVTTLCAILATGFYCLVVGSITGRAFEPAHAAGFISCVLFLVPGFPLVASLLDLLQHQTVAGIVRLTYGTLILLAAAFGLSVVAAIAASPPALPQARLTASSSPLFCGTRSRASSAAASFAVLYNSPARTVLSLAFFPCWATSCGWRCTISAWPCRLPHSSARSRSGCWHRWREPPCVSRASS